MLVLVSFGLVLLATILLVVGLLSDDGINLIYLSIAASATAAVVLFSAFRMARPKGDEGSDAPAPLADDIAPPDVAATKVVEAPPREAVAPAAPPVPEPVAAPTEDDWADDADWVIEDEEVDFPIADYDDLTVAEILPLLPQLYSDELDIVYQREQDGKNRSSILGELDKLRQTGTEADALEAVGTAEPEPSAPAAEPATAAVGTTGRTSLLEDDFDEDGAFFPIADYDDLSVSQIVPLLPQLELDELRDVRDREVAGANRTTLVSEIDRYLSGELEAYVFEDEAEEESAPVDPEVERLPIRNYPDLNVSEVLAQLDDLSPAQIEQVLEFEAARDNRFGIVEEAKRRLDVASPAAPTRPRRTKKAAKRTTKKAGTTKRAAKKKSASKKSAAKKKSTSKKSAAKKSTSKKSTAKKSTKRAGKSAKKRTAARFPIANYDELNVADIRPRLTDLSPSQLRQVRDREETGAGRKTILNEIDSKLS